MGRIFISYAHADQVWADAYRESLEDCGYDVWIDHKNIRLAKKFEEEIRNGIENADTFHVLVSDALEASDYCKKEIAYAFEQKRPEDIKDWIIPIWRKKVTGEAHLDLPPLQGVDFCGKTFDVGFRELVEKLEHVGFKSTPRWKFDDPDHVKGVTTIGQLAEQWRSKLDKTQLAHKKYASLLIGRTGYGDKAYIVAPPDAPLSPTHSAQVFLWYNGLVKENSFRPFLEYKETNLTNPDVTPVWALLITGPVAKTDTGLEYKLPEDSPAVWLQSIDFIHAMIARATNGHGYPLEFYLTTPNALSMKLGEYYKNRIPFVPYHRTSASGYKNYYLAIK